MYLKKREKKRVLSRERKVGTAQRQKEELQKEEIKMKKRKDRKKDEWIVGLSLLVNWVGHVKINRKKVT